MAQIFYLSALTSDLSGGADFNRKLVSAVESTNSISVVVASTSTEDSFAFTEPGIPGTIGSTGNYTTVVKISANNATGPSLAIAWARVNSSGVQQAISAFTASQAVTTSTQTLTFTGSSINLGTWAAGDRLKVVYRFGNTSGGGRTFTVETGSTSATVTVPFASLAIDSVSYSLSLTSVSLYSSRSVAVLPMTLTVSFSDVGLVKKTYKFGSGGRVFNSPMRRTVFSGARR